SRRGDPGRRVERRGEGRSPAGRHAADPRHRDAGRRVHPADRAQHDHPDQKEPDLLHGRGRPDGGDDQRPAGRAGDGGRQQVARPLRPRGHPARAARRAPDRSHLRHRRERHRPRRGQGPGDAERAIDPDHRVQRLEQGRDRQDGQGRPGPRGGRQEEARAGRGPQRGRQPNLWHREAPLRARRQDQRGGSQQDQGRDRGDSQGYGGQRPGRHPDGHAEPGQGLAEDRRGNVQKDRVDRNASEEEIKKAYRRLARQHHPDTQTSEEEKKKAEEKFKEINEAYATLSDQDKRRRYDTFGHAEGPQGFEGFGQGFGDIFND